MSAAERFRQLGVVADYQDHYGKPCWAGRDGTTEDVLDALVEEGYLDRIPDEHRTRWWYAVSAEGRVVLEEAR